MFYFTCDRSFNVNNPAAVGIHSAAEKSEADNSVPDFFRKVVAMEFSLIYEQHVASASRARLRCGSSGGEIRPLKTHDSADR